MSKSNPTAGERIVKIETKIDSIEEQNRIHSNLLNKIETKLDTFMECKADRVEVETIRTKVNNITMGAMASVVTLLITAIGFLLKYTLFK